MVAVIHAPLNKEIMINRLGLLFDIGEVQEISFAHGGYMSQNFRIDTSSGAYFLKQYRNRISTVLHEIKHAERYFASHGLPVIVPVADRYGRPSFWLDGHWFSLFPFIDGSAPIFGQLTNAIVRSQGQMLGRFHEAGRKFEHWHFQPLRLWDKDKFFMEFVELEQELLSRSSRSVFENRILDVLRLKAKIVRANTLLPHHLPLSYDGLLHGDFIYQNTFMNEKDEVTHVFDLEKTCIGPRAYELARSLLVTCFDDGWEEKNFDLARTFLEGYRKKQGMTYEEFERGVKMYMINVTHMTWIEAKFVMYQDEDHLPLYERHARRIEQIGKSSEGFCERIYR